MIYYYGVNDLVKDHIRNFYYNSDQDLTICHYLYVWHNTKGCPHGGTIKYVHILPRTSRVPDHWYKGKDNLFSKVEVAVYVMDCEYNGDDCFDDVDVTVRNYTNYIDITDEIDDEPMVLEPEDDDDNSLTIEKGGIVTIVYRVKYSVDGEHYDYVITPYNMQGPNNSNYGYWYEWGNGCDVTPEYDVSHANTYGADSVVVEIDTGTGGGVGGEPKSSCHTDDNNYEVGEETEDTWGVLVPRSFGESQDKNAVWCDITFPWDDEGEYVEDEVLRHLETKEFQNGDTNEYCSYKVEIFDGDPSTMYNIYECWWEEHPTGDRFVDGINGDDSNFGYEWDSAFATIEKGVNDVESGGTVHIYPYLYDGENINTPSECTLLVDNRPDTNVEDSNNEYINGDTVLWLPYTIESTDLCTAGDDSTPSGETHDGNVHSLIDVDNPTVSCGTYIYKITVFNSSNYNRDVKPFVLRPDGDYYRLIYKSPYWVTMGTLKVEHYTYVPVKSGDIVGAVYKNVRQHQSTSGGSIREYSDGEVMGDTLKSEWTETNDENSGLSVYALVYDG